MVKHVLEPDSSKWDVIDLDTGKRLERVQFANDETGYYDIIIINEDGSLKECICDKCGDNHMLIEHKKGNIKLIKKE